MPFYKEISQRMPQSSLKPLRLSERIYLAMTVSNFQEVFQRVARKIPSLVA